MIAQRQPHGSHLLMCVDRQEPQGQTINHCNIAITLVDQLSGLECLMRWVLLFFGSLATGVMAIVLSLTLLLVSLSIYDRYVLGIASNGAVGWDPVSIYGRYWVIGIPLLIFGLGCSAGFWFLSKRLHR
jgi:hypothetical protein